MCSEITEMKYLDFLKLKLFNNKNGKVGTVFAFLSLYSTELYEKTDLVSGVLSSRQVFTFNWWRETLARVRTGQS